MGGAVTIENLDISRLFDASGEAVFGVRNGETVFMNPRARALFAGRDPLSAVLPELGTENSEALCSSVEIDGEEYAVTAACGDGLWLACLSRQREPADSGLAVNVSGQISSSVMSLRAAASALSDVISFRGAETGEYESIIYRELFRLQRLAGNLKALGGASELCLIKRPRDMAEFVGDLIDSVNHFFDGRIELDVSVGGRTVMADIDEDWATRMMLNVLSNSIARMNDGGRVSVSLRQSTGRAVITVRDTCGGIPPEVLGSVFARYSAADVSAFVSGAGTGLAAAQSIARAHGGSILLESRSGVGATVSILLPLSDVSCVRAPAGFSSGGMELLLTGLSGVLGREFYNKKYMD